MKKHVEHEHQEVLSKYYREVLECRLIPPSLGEKNASKKRDKVTPGAISSSFSSSVPYKKHNEQQKSFIEDLVLLIAKGYHPLSSVENIWLRRFALHRDPRVVFPSRGTITEEMLPAMLEQTLARVVRPHLEACSTMTATFDL